MYAGMFIFFIGKSCYYEHVVGHFPDESVHISYVAYLDANHAIIPDFKDMTILVPTNGKSVEDSYQGSYTFGTTTNYLGHPPLYYQILLLSRGVTVQNGLVYINIGRLRLFSLMLACLGLLLAFYIGFTRIRPVFSLHVLYGVVCVSVPMFAYISGGVNNDTLAYVGVIIYFLALVRLSEKRLNTPTYLILSLGVTLSLLAKLTAGMLVLGSLALYLLYTLIKTHKLEFFTKRGLWYTFPVYLIAAAYYAAVRLQTGSFQPTYSNLNPQQYLSSGFYVPPAQRTHMAFRTYFIYFFKGFEQTWTGIFSHVAVIKFDSILAVDQIALTLLGFLPVLLLFIRSKSPETNWKGFAPLTMYFSTIALVALQFIRAFYEYRYVSGYTGGWQSRYYLCAVPAIGMCLVYIAQNILEHNAIAPAHSASEPAVCFSPQKIRNAAVHIVCLGFSALLIYEDFICFLINLNGKK